MEVLLLQVPLNANITAIAVVWYFFLAFLFLGQVFHVAV